MFLDNVAGKVSVLDVFSNKEYKLDNGTYNYSVLLQKLVPSRFGLTPSDRALLQIMGKKHFSEFLKNREEFLVTWRQREFSYPDFPLQQLNELLVQSGSAPF